MKKTSPSVFGNRRNHISEWARLFDALLHAPVAIPRHAHDPISWCTLSTYMEMLSPYFEKTAAKAWLEAHARRSAAALRAATNVGKTAAEGHMQWLYEHSGFAAGGLHQKLLRPLPITQILMTGVRPFIGCSWRVIVFNNYGFLLMFIMQKLIKFLLAYFVLYLLGAHHLVVRDILMA